MSRYTPPSKKKHRPIAPTVPAWGPGGPSPTSRDNNFDPHSTASTGNNEPDTDAPSYVELRQVPCDECGNRNRTARRACNSCYHLGVMLKYVPVVKPLEMR